MSAKNETRARLEDVQRRWEARMWLTEAIQRAQAEGIDVAPAFDLLEALENLDAIEIVKDIGGNHERIVGSNVVGPAGTVIKADQVMRLTGKISRMLAMPEVSDTIVSGKGGGRCRTPPEVLRKAFACAAITRMMQLGMSQESAFAFVEEDLGPTVSDWKKVVAGSASKSLIGDYNNELNQLASMDKDQVIARIVMMAKVRTRNSSSAPLR